MLSLNSYHSEDIYSTILKYSGYRRETFLLFNNRVVSLGFHKWRFQAGIECYETLTGLKTNETYLISYNLKIFSSKADKIGIHVKQNIMKIYHFREIYKASVYDTILCILKVRYFSMTRERSDLQSWRVKGRDL